MALPQWPQRQGMSDAEGKNLKLPLDVPPWVAGLKSWDHLWLLTSRELNQKQGSQCPVWCKTWDPIIPGHGVTHYTTQHRPTSLYYLQNFTHSVFLSGEFLTVIRNLKGVILLCLILMPFKYLVMILLAKHVVSS